MKMKITGMAPNVAIRLEAETEAEEDQINRATREAFERGIQPIPKDADDSISLRKLILRLEA